jgi:hypothetical protein
MSKTVKRTQKPRKSMSTSQTPDQPKLVNRMEFLAQIESLQPGLSPREIIEQSSCIVFTGKEMATYNDEISCRCPTTITIIGAVSSAPLLALCRKLSEDEISIHTSDEGEFILKGKRRSAGLRYAAQIELPVDKVERPKKWKPLSEEWLEAIALVAPCCSKEEQFFAMTCVHIAPEFIEACDNFQATRVKLNTGMDKSICVKRDSIKNIITMGMTQVAETESWIHFKNPAGLVLSCRRYAVNYPNLAPILAFQGHKVQLPKGLGEAAEKAQIFTKENPEEAQKAVEVALKDGKLRLIGNGVSGWYKESKKVEYDGPPLRFRIAPDMLMEIAKKNTKAEISPEKLRISGSSWEYVTSLSLADLPKDTSSDTETE